MLRFLFAHSLHLCMATSNFKYFAQSAEHNNIQVYGISYISMPKKHKQVKTHKVNKNPCHKKPEKPQGVSPRLEESIQNVLKSICSITIVLIQSHLIFVAPLSSISMTTCNKSIGIVSTILKCCTLLYYSNNE